MTQRRVGLWLIGAFGGVGTTITLGLTALAKGLTNSTGLVSELPMFQGLPLPPTSAFVVGGHDIRRSSFAESAEEFRKNSGVFDSALIDACRDELAAASKRVRPGTKLGSGPTIDKLGDWEDPQRAGSPAQAVDRIAADLASFVETEQIDHLIVMNVASTEPVFRTSDVHLNWNTLKAALADGDGDMNLLPSSSLYALAALRGGHTYINFTPSMGASIPRAVPARRVNRCTTRRQGWQDRGDFA